MQITLGVPVLEGKELTKEFLQSIVDTVANPGELHVILIDNGSKEEPYDEKDYNFPFKLTVKRYEVNQGFYLPLLWMYQTYGTSDILALCHNDIYFYEKAWDNRVRHVFAADPQLGLVGFCGSPEADYYGGRGRGTICNFRGERGGIAGPKIDALVPCVFLDSLFMAFRASAVPSLRIDNEITPCHFYDKIWCMRMLETFHHVAMLGIEIDHMGGTTSTKGPYQEDAKRWCEEHGLPLEQGSGDLALYHEGERRLLTEYRDQKGLIPCRIDTAYKLWKF